MKKVTIFYLVFAFLFMGKLVAQDTSIDKLFRSSYRVWELQRNNVGMYRDSKLFNGADFHPCSIANVGIGLISLCIADSMGWDNAAAGKALITLESLTGHTMNFNPDRNASGFFRHFIDMNSGEQYWNSEYSTIDTEILVAGALFARNYFKNDSISKYAMELWNSIEHEKAIADAENGKIFLTMNADGTGTANSLTSVYNEYMIVAWMAKHASTQTDSPAQILWDKYFADPANLPHSTYGEFNILTDQTGSFLSSFTHLFNYYLCNYFTTSEKYIEELKQARLADVEWWKTNTAAAEWEWGCGAGTGPEGYHADRINENINQTVSPHIIAGFLPVFPEGETQLRVMWTSKKGRYVFPIYPGDVFLWRYSLKKPDWIATEIQGIDYSTMLFGLSTLPQFLGQDFFKRNNNIFIDFPLVSPIFSEEQEKVKLKNNPAGDSLILELTEDTNSPVKIEILNAKSELILTKEIKHWTTGSDMQIALTKLVSGIYFLRLSSKGKILDTKKFIKN